ncbi:MAG: hypothetical protein HQ464_07855 [Planctomycetes bacterium]|nr:hypothetical protein [Planctomycetota bacterium]
MRRVIRLVACSWLCLAAAGCGPSNVPKERAIQVARDPLKDVRSFLEGYVQGQSVGSEVELFPKLVDEIRNTDADKAAVVESGLADIVKSPSTARARAKKLLVAL